MYIGDVYIPAITELSIDSQQQKVVQFKALGLDHPVSVSFRPANARRAAVGAVLYETDGKDADDYAEDVLALLRSAGYNYIDGYGLLEVESVDIPRTAESQLLREASIRGYFMPETHYVRRIAASPSVLANDFSLTLSSTGVESIVWLPAGANVVAGGDGTTYTRTTADGTITGVLAETTPYVDFDGCGERDVGEVKVWDGCGTADEANWKRVHSIDHAFEGQCVVENGLIRVSLASEGTELYVWRDGAWHSVGEVRGYDGFYLTHVRTITPDTFEADVMVGGSPAMLSLRRGHYLASIRAMEAVQVGMDTITARYAYVEGDTLVDAWAEDASAWHDGGDTDNYAVLVQDAQYVVFGSTHGIQAYADATNDVMSAVRATLPTDGYAFVGAVPFAHELLCEAEDMTTNATSAPCASASGGYKVQLDAQDEYVRMYREVDTGATYPLLPRGTYKAVWRAKDSAQVADDLYALAFNQTDLTFLGTLTCTLTSSWALYELEFTIDADDAGDIIYIGASKATATTNTIDVDCCYLVPLSVEDGVRGARDVAHQALVDMHMRRRVVQR